MNLKPFLFLLVIFLGINIFFFANQINAQSTHLSALESINPEKQNNSQKEIPKVLVVNVEEEIRAGTVQFIERTLRKAETDGFNFFIIQIDTPGGLLKATQEISRLLIESEITTVVFVHKSGGWAFSAGTFILLSAEIAVSHPNASIGAAQPRALGFGGAAQPDEKIIKATSQWIKSIAEARNRNSEVAGKFVQENLSLSGKEALEHEVIDFTASSFDELLVQLDIYNAFVKNEKPNSLEHFLSFISLPHLVPLLLSLGALGLFFVFRTGEIEIGAFAVIFLLLGLWGMGAITISTLGIIFLILGVSLILLEAFLSPGFGVLGIGGTMAFLFGIITFSEEPFLSNPLTQVIFWLILGAAFAVSVFFILVSKWSAKTLQMKIKTGPESLIGETAIVIKPLNPFGKIKIEREDWTAKNILDEADIPIGKKVEIIKVQGNVVIVKLITKVDKIKN